MHKKIFFGCVGVVSLVEGTWVVGSCLSLLEVSLNVVEVSVVVGVVACEL